MKKIFRYLFPKKSWIYRTISYSGYQYNENDIDGFIKIMCDDGYEVVSAYATGHNVFVLYRIKLKL